MVRRLAIVVGWLALAIIVFATLSPIGLRPETGHPTLERFAAFFLGGLCFAIGYPRRRGWVALGIVAVAIGLEAAQLLAPGRDARVHDALVKIIGGVAGVALASVVDSLVSGWRRGPSG